MLNFGIIVKSTFCDEELVVNTLIAARAIYSIDKIVCNYKKLLTLAPNMTEHGAPAEQANRFGDKH